MKNKSSGFFTTVAILALGTFAATAKPDKPKKPHKPKTHHLSFAQADVDESGSLDIFEFATTMGPGVPLVEVRRRFLPIDVSGAFEVVLDPITEEPIPGDPIPDGFITPEELAAYRAGERTKSDLPRFELADFDGDGVLTPVEFSYLTSPKVKFSNISRKFVKLDTDDDGFLTKEEFKKPESDPA
jgi:hypothetical protein